MIIKNILNDAMILSDIIFGLGVAMIVSVLVIHTMYPPAYRQCEAQAAALGLEYSYNSFEGCIISEE